jgi:prephenate dehydrogenase
VKSGAVEEMLKGVQPGVEVLGMHTIFGPSVGQLEGQHVVLTRTATSGPLAGEMEALFFKYGATIVRATPNHHDRQMAFHQNLEHFVKIVMAEVIRREFPDLEEFEKFSSPNSRATLATMGRILRGTPDVLAEIQQFNRVGPQMIGTFLETAKALGDDLIAGRVANFRESLAASIAAFGPERLQRYVEGTFK